MARLPQVGGDAGNWGEILNDYLSVSHNADGTLSNDTVGISQLQSNSVTNSAIISGSITENKLAITNNPSTGTVLGWDGNDLTWTTPAAPPVTSVNGKTGTVSLTKADVSLGNVDNTSDANKPVSVATQTSLNAKANTADLASVATSGSYTDLSNKPSIPADNTLVHLAGAETITGNKNFTGQLTQGGNAIVITTDSRLTDTRTPTDGTVTTAKVADGAITNAKLATNVQTMMTDTQAARDETIVAVDGQSSWTGAVSLTSAQSKSKYVRRLLTGNTTVTMAAGDSGKAYSCTLELQQDATGSRTIVLVNVSTPYGVALPLSTTANNVDIIRLEWNGTRWAGFVAGPQMSIPSAWVV